MKHVTSSERRYGTTDFFCFYRVNDSDQLLPSGCYKLNREKPEPEKTGALQPEPPAEFPDEPGKAFQPETKKTGGFQPEPPGNFPVERETRPVPWL